MASIISSIWFTRNKRQYISASSDAYVPILKNFEGGYVNAANDPGGETQQGITWNTWQGYFGNTHDRFVAMDPSDWLYIYNDYWNKIQGDAINSQAVANMIMDYAWGSGPGTAAEAVETILNNDFGANVAVNGQIGANDIIAINNANPEALTKAIGQYRIDNYNNPAFKQGWDDRWASLMPGGSNYAGNSGSLSVTAKKAGFTGNIWLDLLLLGMGIATLKGFADRNN